MEFVIQVMAIIQYIAVCHDSLDQLFKQMNLFTCIRLKINLFKREDKILEHGMHVDFKDDVPKRFIDIYTVYEYKQWIYKI